MLKRITSYSIETIFLFAVFLACLTYFFYSNYRFINIPIVEDHAFRQTQTALTAYYLIKNGFSLAYETPVVGQGWGIPFEFPLYQYLTALITQLLNSDLSRTGRLINLTFTSATCIPFYFSLKLLKVKPSAIFFSLALFISSPIYLFWGGTFMIEGTALFLMMGFFYFGLALIFIQISNKYILFYSLFLCLALLQKVTTVLPVFCILSLIFLYKFFSADKKNYLNLLKVFLATAISLMIAYGWIKFSDSVKLSNPIGISMTSSAMSSWNYGSIDDRLSLKLWLNTIYLRNIHQSSFYIFGSLVIIWSLFILKDWHIKKIVILFLLLFFLPFFIFTNLHIRHNYYQIANSIFYSAAVGISIVYLFDNYSIRLGRIQKPLMAAIALVFVYYNFVFFNIGPLNNKLYSPNEDSKLTFLLAKYIKENTSPNSNTIWLTKMGWSSEFAFYSERKSLTWVNQGDQALEMVENWPKYLRSEPAAIVFCLDENNGINEKFIVAIEKQFSNSKSTKIQNCLIYLINK